MVAKETEKEEYVLHLFARTVVKGPKQYSLLSHAEALSGQQMMLTLLRWTHKMRKIGIYFKGDRMRYIESSICRSQYVCDHKQSIHIIILFLLLLLNMLNLL